MADRLQIKRGTTARRLTYTPVDGELVYDKTLNKLFVGNGSTAGGVSLEADDNTRYAKEESMTSSRRYMDLVQAYFAGQTVKGAIVIHLPVSRNANNTMVYMNIRGYNYLNNNGAFSLMLGFYQYNGNNIIQTSASCNGMFPSNMVRYGKAVDHTVIILGDTDTVWSYPNIRVAEFVACYSGFTDWTNGWSMAMETDLSAYGIKATPPVYGSNLSKTAEESTKLSTPRNINGTPFDGTANITVVDNTKLSTGGGTVTGQVTIHGTAGNYPLRVRGITGTNGTTADGPLYLQYGIGEATHFGITGSYTISADGSQYSGSAAKLTTPRLINGTAFDGSKNINISDDTKLPLSGGKLTGPIEIPSAGASWIGGTGGLSAIRLAPSTASSWHPWISQRTNAGNSWAIGQLGETWSISWAPKANIDEGTNATTQVISVSSSGVTVTGTLNVTGDLVGTPTTATVADGTNNTRLATTAFVQNTVGGYLNKTGLTGGTVTLTNVEVSNAVLSFSGTLTSNLIIVVPTTNRRLWSAINATTGNFTLTVKTASGTGVTVAQGKRNLIYTDGTNVQDGFNDFENIALTGIPTAPTAATATSNTQVASTAFVQAVNSADTGSSSTALTLKNARTFTYTGDVTGSVSFNGGANVSAALTLANSGVSAGTYKSVTVDVKGRVTAGADVVTSLVTSTSATGVSNVATTNTNTYLNVVEKVGTANASAGTSTQITGAGSVTVASDTAGKLTITGAQNITGKAGSADTLVAADSRAIKPDGTGKKAVSAYFTSEAGLNGTANAVYGDLLVLNGYGDTSGGTINALFFGKGTKKITHYNAAQGATVWGTAHEIAYTTDNVASATKLQTARTINGTAFDGTADITIVDSTKAPLNSPALTGTPTGPTAATTTNTTQLATTAFVQAVNVADTGGSSTALTLKTARTFTYTGDVTGSVSFNGGANVSTAMTLANTGVAAGTYKSVTVDTKGRVTAGADVVTSLVTSTSSTGTTNVATTNTNTFLNVVEKVGTANASTGTSSQITGAGTVTVVSDTAGKITITGAQTITGNAATATKLQTARTINGVAFDGTKNITIGENNGVFIGAVQWFSGTRAGIPDGYAAADGQLVNRATYPELWASVNGGVFPIVTDAVWVSNITNRASYSQGNGSSTFRFPDLNGIQTNSLKGLFVRGDGNAGITSGKTQEDAIRNITGALNPMGWWEGVLTGQEGAFYGEGVNKGYNEAGTSKNGGRVLFDASRVVPTADENRPVSAVGIWIIRVNGGTSPLPASGSPATLQANSFNGTQSITGNLTVSGSVTFGNINNLPILGVNQTYQNLVTTRAFGVTYVNTTKASIFVMVSSSGGSLAIMPYVDDLLLGWSMSTYNNGNPRHMVSFIVPPGSTYKVTGGYLDYWTELR